MSKNDVRFARGITQQLKYGHLVKAITSYASIRG